MLARWSKHSHIGDNARHFMPNSPSSICISIRMSREGSGSSISQLFLLALLLMPITCLAANTHALSTQLRIRREVEQLVKRPTAKDVQPSVNIAALGCTARLPTTSPTCNGLAFR
jgi:hypothetical protein